MWQGLIKGLASNSLIHTSAKINLESERPFRLPQPLQEKPNRLGGDPFYLLFGEKSGPNRSAWQTGSPSRCHLLIRIVPYNEGPMRTPIGCCASICPRGRICLWQYPARVEHNCSSTQHPTEKMSLLSYAPRDIYTTASAITHCPLNLKLPFKN